MKYLARFFRPGGPPAPSVEIYPGMRFLLKTTQNNDPFPPKWRTEVEVHARLDGWVRYSFITEQYRGLTVSNDYRMEIEKFLMIYRLV